LLKIENKFYYTDGEEVRLLTESHKIISGAGKIKYIYFIELFKFSFLV